MRCFNSQLPMSIVMSSILWRISMFVMLTGHGVAEQDEDIQSTTAATIPQYKGQVTFTLTNVKTLTPYQPRRFIDPGWSGVENLPACAYRTLRESSHPFGFFYNQNEKLCTPILGFGEYGTSGSGEVDDHEGQLYIFKMDCPIGYQLFETMDGRMCLRPFSYKATYEEATSVCMSWGGYLVAVLTRTKLDLVIQMSNGEDFWIGLDDLEVEDQFVWQYDGSVMTEEQRSNIFTDGQPNNYNGNQHCVVYQDPLLHDWDCSKVINFVCESSPVLIDLR